MKRINGTTVMLLFAALLQINQLHSQSKGLTGKIFIGPECTHLISGDNADSRGIGMGFTGGVLFDINIGKPTYFVFGANYAYINNTRFLDRSANQLSNTGGDEIHSAEVPVGIGFNLSPKHYKQFYTNWSLVNNMVIASESEVLERSTGQEINETKLKNYLGFYTPGIKAELGFNTALEDQKPCSIAISAKYLFWNWNKINTDQLRTLSVAVTFGITL